jgi:hypothetical protein
VSDKTMTTQDSYIEACREMRRALLDENTCFDDIYFAAKELFYAANDYMMEG